MVYRISLADPRADPVAIGSVTRALQEERFLRGASVAEFESAFAAATGVKHAVSVNSGYTAIYLALRAAGVKPGDRVATVGAGFVSSLEAILQCGAKPAWVEIDPVTMTMSPESLAATLRADKGGKIRAVLPVHLYGQPCDAKAILELAHAYGAVLVWDACQAHGAKSDSVDLAAWPDMACYSFYPTKNLTVGGDGGMVTTSKADYALLVAQMRDCGRGVEDPGEYTVRGTTGRLGTMAAAYGKTQVPHLSEWVEARRRNAAQYHLRLEALGDALTLPSLPDFEHSSAPHLYVPRVANRDGLVAYLRANHVEAGVHYPRPIWGNQAYAEWRPRRNLKVTEEWARTCVSLPVHPGLTLSDVDMVCGLVQKWFGEEWARLNK